VGAPGAMQGTQAIVLARGSFTTKQGIYSRPREEDSEPSARAGFLPCGSANGPEPEHHLENFRERVGAVESTSFPNDVRNVSPLLSEIGARLLPQGSHAFAPSIVSTRIALRVGSFRIRCRPLARWDLSSASDCSELPLDRTLKATVPVHLFNELSGNEVRLCLDARPVGA
jgi:hypothetical protein